MKRVLSPKRMLILLGFALSIQTFASFVDNGARKKTSAEISLKNFRKNSYKNMAYPDFRLSKFQFKGSTNVYQSSSENTVVGQSFIHLENGNTTYVYPYKYKVKVPFFKTPSAPGAH